MCLNTKEFNGIVFTCGIETINAEGVNAIYECPLCIGEYERQRQVSRDRAKHADYVCEFAKFNGIYHKCTLPFCVKEGSECFRAKE